MIDAILTGLFSFVSSGISFFLIPLDTLVQNYLPNLSNALTAFQSFLALCVGSIGWVISALGIPGIVIELIIAYYTFALVVPLLVYSVKLIIKWYHALVP